MRIGIDVSEWQKNIDWSKVKGNIDFVILRLGWTGNNSNKIDKYFERNYSECKKLGIPVGVYVYNYATTETAAKKGALWTLEQLKGKELDLPVYLDMEDKCLSNITREKLTKICIAFNKEIESKKLWAGVYASANFFKVHLNTDEIKKRYTTWVAHYNVKENTYNGVYDMLQYSSKGKITGIEGNVDMNIMYRDLISQIKGSNPEPKESEEKNLLDGKIVEIINKIINKYGEDDFEKALSRLVETYKDDKEPSGWALKEVEEAKQLGITDGSNPQMFATRQEVMMMCYRTYKKANEK